MSKKNKGIIIAVVSVVLVIAISAFLTCHQTGPLFVINKGALNQVNIEPNAWEPLAGISEGDTTNVIEVTYNRKYGKTITIYCNAVFFNKKEARYKCLAPWLGTLNVEESNITDFFHKKIAKSEAPENYKEFRSE